MTPLRVVVLSFAQIREIVGAAAQELEIGEGSTVRDAWNELARRHAGLVELTDSTRIARNGSVVSAETPLHDGDEIALLPPVGGG